MSKPIVLVHGAWSGSWIWARVAKALRARGAEAHTPSLTGVGERVHLASPEIDLETHVLDVLNVLRYEASPVSRTERRSGSPRSSTSMLSSRRTEKRSPIF